MNCWSNEKVLNSGWCFVQSNWPLPYTNCGNCVWNSSFDTYYAYCSSLGMQFTFNTSGKPRGLYSHSLQKNQILKMCAIVVSSVQLWTRCRNGQRFSCSKYNFYLIALTITFSANPTYFVTNCRPHKFLSMGCHFSRLLVKLCKIFFFEDLQILLETLLNWCI